jgi:hypothetical protein
MLRSSARDVKLLGIARTYISRLYLGFFGYSLTLRNFGCLVTQLGMPDERLERGRAQERLQDTANAQQSERGAYKAAAH